MTDKMDETTGPAVVKLQPIIGTNLRAAVSSTRETLFGKQNRITLGHPLINRINPEELESLLAADHVQRFNPSTHVFTQVELSLTLLPDRDCRFVSADLIVSAGNLSEGKQPLFDQII